MPHSTCVDERAPHGVHALLRECSSLFAWRAYATPAAERLAPSHFQQRASVASGDARRGAHADTRCSHGGLAFSCHSSVQPRAPLPRKRGAMRVRCIGIPRMARAAPGGSGGSNFAVTKRGELPPDYVLSERPEKIDLNHPNAHSTTCVSAKLRYASRVPR